MTEAAGSSNRYPDDQVSALKKQVAEFWNVGMENILFGAGSSEFLGLVSLLVSSNKGTIITAEPSYRVWNGQAESFGLGFKRIPVATDKTLDLASNDVSHRWRYKNDVCMQSKQSYWHLC